VATDAAGSFRQPFVIMRHAALGPRSMVVQEQPGLFPAVTADHLTTAPSFRPSSNPFTGRTALVSRG
jgi:hypothetical protein